MEFVAHTPREIAAKLPTEIPWIIKPFMMEGSIMMLYGRQGIGKSSLCLQLAHSMLTGDPWLGFPVQKTGRVLYIQLDMATLEMHSFLVRADNAGLHTEGLFVSDWETGFMATSPRHTKALREWCDEYQPVMVIVDTINDAFAGGAASNDDVRLLLRRIQRAVEPACMVFTNHERKKSKWEASHNEEDLPDDEDAFLGWQSFEGVSSASVRLQRKGTEFWLYFRKVRLDKLGFSRLRVLKDEYGFFYADLSSQQMLLQWPGCLPARDKEEILASLSHMNDVFRDIAERCGVTFDSVKKQFQRERDRGVQHEWLKLLPEAGTEAGTGESVPTTSETPELVESQ